MIEADRLESLLVEMLPSQRWFGHKGHRIAGVRDIAQEALGDGLVWVAATVELPDAPAARYHVPLGVSGGEVFDATTRPATSIALLHCVAPGEQVGTARPLGAEQSNSSVVYDERLILKLYRRPPDGPNPDAEVTDALAARGFANVAPLLGRWSVDGVDRAIAQPFLRGGTDGWELAVAAARAGDDFSAEAGRLGAVTAALHGALADAFGTYPPDVTEWEANVANQLERTGNSSVDGDAVASAVAVMRTLEDCGAALRVHGDYHLGQVLRTDDRWYVLDFEGEPARPLSERRAPASPLRDVAGMLRSFDYAGRVGGADPAWEQACRHALVDAYADAVADRGLVPSDPAAFTALLTVFELEKAVYEVGYEAANRPDWVDIPLAAVRRLLEPA